MPVDMNAYERKNPRQEQIEALAGLERSLGFIETEEMIALRKRFISELSARPEIIMRWAILSEKEIESETESVTIRKVMAGVRIAQARLLLESGLHDQFTEMLEEEMEAAFGENQTSRELFDQLERIKGM